ncbi:hypothetical protein D6833_07380, partial [Candidatus Parcubacteria bacterium]
SAVELGLWLCGIPLLQATRNLLRILTAASQREKYLNVVFPSHLIITVAINLWLVTAEGLGGAVAALYASELLLILMLAPSIRWYLAGKTRRSR